MATILDEQISSAGSPYAYYTVTANASNRTTNGITINGTVYGHLRYSDSYLGTGSTMGLIAYLTINGVEQNGIELKSTSNSWSGTSTHSVNYQFTINNLQPTQTSISIKFRVSRTGSAANNYSASSSLAPTNCNSLTIPQGIGKTTFNSITNPTTNGVFTLDINYYSAYDVLTIKNGNTIIKTITGHPLNTTYSFTEAEQTTLITAIGSNRTSIDLTVILESFVSEGGTSLGSTTKTMTVSLPEYVPTIIFTSVSDNVTTYNTFKNNITDIIKTLSKPNIIISVSDNFNNTYVSAVCNGVSGTINGRTITFNNLNQENIYNITVTDSRGKTGSLSISGDNYSATIKTIQWYKGSLQTTIIRPSPTGSTALVTVKPTIYDGTNFKTSALLSLAFTLKYTQAGSSEVTVQSSSFTQSLDTYIYTIQNLDPTKTVTWNVTGTDLIGAVTNGDSGTLGIGLPVMNAYIGSNGEQYFKINGNSILKKDLSIIGDTSAAGISATGNISTNGSMSVAGTTNINGNLSLSSNAKTTILNLIYPVGSIYMSVNNTSPASFIGGTWERIQDTFLLSAGSTYSAGSTGGEATHVLTINEMPSHTHQLDRGNYGNARWEEISYSSGGSPATNANGVHYTGGGQAHNNMPPYLAVYVWKRTN